MGNCVQCYPCFIKINQIEEKQSSLYIPQIVNDIEKNEENNRNLQTDNNLNGNENNKKI